jgi:formylglycine-generating enzyme
MSLNGYWFKLYNHLGRIARIFMQTLNKLAWIAAVLITTSTSAQVKKQQAAKTPAAIEKHLKGMKFIEGGSFTSGRSGSEIFPGKNDTTLLVSPRQRRISLSSFYISDHEVTNAEYRMFINWVTDSIKKVMEEKKDTTLFLHNERFYPRKTVDTDKLVYKCSSGSDTLSVKVYPDTLCWIKDYSYSSLNPLAQNYFWHPAYDYYPVVGISWRQARAYCSWKTKLLIAALNKDKTFKGQVPEYRLPTEAEWEYAAIGAEKQNTKSALPDRDFFPWPGNTIINTAGKYPANFGVIYDQNGLLVKGYADDNYFFTSPVRSFTPNSYQLYDMGGNVSEWVMDVARTNNDSLAINFNDDPEKAVQKLIKWRQMDGQMFDAEKLSQAEKDGLESMAGREIHNAKVYHSNYPGRIVKGGSWANGATYLQCGSREVFPENKSSSRTGFRIAMNFME